MMLDRSFGPYGFKQKIVVCYPPESGQKREYLETNHPLSFEEMRDDGTMTFIYAGRSMSKGDDETLVYELQYLLPNGYWIDWDKSEY